MLLAVDCGNTRTKWAVFNAASEIQSQGACLNTELVTIDFSPSILCYERVVISNVAGEQCTTILTEKILLRPSNICWIKSTSQICNVINRYSNPESLGTDRWASLIAAWHIKQLSCIVVNAGTAVTIDALVSKNNHAEFIGGLILPGLNLMQKSLGCATAQLPIPIVSKNTQQQDIFAKNTTDAMNTGALTAITGAIMLMANALKAQCTQPPTIIISGGNAQQIKDNLEGNVTNQALIVDNLVLQGLYLIDNFMHKQI
ncbi:MAG: type III pantothenate kinase [Methylotenera sp.]|nr:type III pantothenate kinase [Methylotenera sp.]